MKFRTLAGAGLSALLLTGTIGLVAPGVAPAIATARLDAKAEKKAAKLAAKASQAIAKRRWEKAVSLAEEAVEINGSDAGYRMLLGNAYLRAGRFQSAAQAFGDVLVLRPGDGRAALNSALAQIALGRWNEARALLDANESAIPAADRGLALALAGDPARGVDVLTAATRSPDADAKTRQNLALAMALAGRWQEARVLIGVDMAPLAADQRIVQWAAFARPAAAADQVASLLGVTPAADPGQPVALALAAAAPVASAEAAPVDAFMPGQVPAAVAADAATARDTPQLAEGPALVQPYMQAQQAAAASPRLIEAPAPYKHALTKASVQRTPVEPARQMASGNWYVQLGAYENAGVAKDGWRRAMRRLPAMAEHKPAGMTASVKGERFYRLSVGGFARSDAMALCRSYRMKGGTCFVRAQAGDQLAAWHKRGTQVAAR